MRGPALAWANSPWADRYFSLWESSLSIGPASAPLTKCLHHWINDGLMAVFFLLVGLDIKRELLVRELATPRQAALPIATAIGGMVVPAGIYAMLNSGGSGAAGWGVPMATDIAFALGVVAVLGSRIPVGLKVFLAAFAIADDLGAVLVIAIFYTTGLSWFALAIALANTAVLIGMKAGQVASLPPYLFCGALLWLALLSSGLHATIAGVVLAFTIPARTRVDARDFSARARGLLDEFDRTETGDLLVLTSKGQQEAIHQLDAVGREATGPLLRLEHALHSTVAFVIMPIFASANAGVQVESTGGLVRSPTAIGVAFGLLLGKPIGITACSWIAMRYFGASLPTAVTMRMIYAVCWVGGIGFTMSLFVAGLAFGDPLRLEAATFGIQAGSLLAGAVGYLLLQRHTLVRRPGAADTDRGDG